MGAMAGHKLAPKHIGAPNLLELPGRCPPVSLLFQTYPGSLAALPSHGWLCTGSSAKGWNSSCFVKSDKCFMSDRETTLTSRGSLPFHQPVDLQPSVDKFLWGNVEFFCTAQPSLSHSWSSFWTESFTLLFFCFYSIFFSPQRIFWSCKLKSSHFFWMFSGLRVTDFSSYFIEYFWRKCSLSRKLCY